MDARIQEKIDMVPMLASVAGRRIMPEPIMLIAVTVVSCTTPIFLLLDKVVPFFLKTYRIIRRWGNLSRKESGGIKMMQSDFLKACIDPICFLQVKETGQKENRPLTKRFRSSTAHKGRARVNFYLLNYIINRGVWQDLFLKYFKKIFPSNSYGKLRTLKENERKWKKMTAIMDWHTLEWYIIFCHEIS